MYMYRSNIACVATVTALISLVCFLDGAHGACTWIQPSFKWWSTPATWPSGIVPARGSDVVIPSGYSIVYDISALGWTFNSINVSSGAQLLVDQNININLATGYIFVQPGGSFKIGSASCPYTNKATITLYGSRSSTLSVSGLGNKGIICGGNLELWGNPPQPTWSSIAATVMPSAKSFTVRDNITNWNVGDTIVMATTDFYAELSEVLKITSVVGSTITVDRPIKYMHYGADNQYAEVASISRNIVIQGDNVTSDTEQYGGHVLLFGNATTKVWGVEFTRMGQRNMIGRYPLHFHIMGDQVGKGHIVSENSFHDNYQRCFTIHGTSGVLVRNNVGWNVTGHCYFLEEGSESMNIYDHNIGILTNPGQLIPTDGIPSIFWISNPNNTFVNNVAVGGYHGFWYSLPATPLGLTSYLTNIRPRNIPMSPFLNNIAHSNQINGVHIDDGPDAKGVTDETMYNPVVDPLASKLVSVRVTITNVTSYKNRMYGIWARGNPLTVDSCLVMDNRGGVNLPFGGNVVSNSMIIGETANIGTLGFTAFFNDTGRSRPKVWFANFPIRGLEFYDTNGNQFGVNNTFVNFTSDSVRNAGAVSVMSGYYILASNVLIKQAKLINSNAFTMETGIDWDGLKYVIAQDIDGSLTGTYGNFIVSDNSILTNIGGCVQRPAFAGFYVCPRNENGFVQVNVKLTDEANVNYTGSSVSATFTPFGQPQFANVVQGVNSRQPTRSSYGLNVPSRGGYVMSFPYPTPAQLSVSLNYAYNGEWTILAFSYPNTTFTITRGYYKTPVTRVSSLAGVTATTYYYDPFQQYLYIMYMEEVLPTNAAGFPVSGLGTLSVDISASCGMNCAVSGVRPIPIALVNNEDKYRSILKGCASANSYEGDAYVRYNPITKKVSFIVYHNVPDAIGATIQDSSTGLIYDMAIPNAPIKGSFDISWTKANQLWNGNWSVVITAANPAHNIRGVIGCSGACTSPPPVSATDACGSAPGEMKVFADSLNANDGWTDWSWGDVQRRNLNYTLDKRCGTASLQFNYTGYNSESLNFHVGDCAPGTCKWNWQHPTINISSYAYLQFNIKSPAGALPFPLTFGGPAGSVAVASKYIDNWVIENSWTRVKLPLSDMGFKGNEMLGLLYLSVNGNIAVNTTVNLLFDDVKLVPAYTDPITRLPSGTVKYFTGAQC